MSPMGKKCPKGAFVCFCQLCVARRSAPMTLGWFVVIAVVCAGGILFSNHIHIRWFYRPSRTQVADLLSRALAGTGTEGELDYFMCMPIKHDSLLEHIRGEFASLYGPSAFEATRLSGEQPSWSPAARERVQAMIKSLASDV